MKSYYTDIGLQIAEYVDYIKIHVVTKYITVHVSILQYPPQLWSNPMSHDDKKNIRPTEGKILPNHTAHFYLLRKQEEKENMKYWQFLWKKAQ